MIEVFKGFWTVNDVRNNPNKIFIFGDNNLRYGLGGQAIIRQEPNTLGIRTKGSPNNNPSSFYSDDNYEDNIARISEDKKNINKKIKEGYTIVFSDGGYGTGLADLKNKAPKTFDFLNKRLLEEFNFNNNI